MAKRRSVSRAKNQPRSSPRQPHGARPGQNQRESPSKGASSSVGATSAKPRDLRRSTYVEAVGLYERGVEALQRRAYIDAVEFLQAVVRRFPEERELVERARLYLKVCARQTAPPEDAPQTIKERLYAATLAINGGRYDEALRHLRLVRDEDPDNDHALYMLAVAHAQRNEPFEAIAHLERAIALNPENRMLARRDPDLDALRDDEAFRSAVEVPAPPAGNERQRRR